MDGSHRPQAIAKVRPQGTLRSNSIALAMCPVAVRSRVLLSLPIQPTIYLQMPPHSEEATQATRARQELQSCLGVHSTALFCTPACSI
jgi:hypothetical protein